MMDRQLLILGNDGRLHGLEKRPDAGDVFERARQGIREALFNRADCFCFTQQLVICEAR